MEKVQNTQTNNSNNQVILYAIAEMAIQYKVPIFPCKADKTPLIKDWQKQATFEKKKIEHWLNTLPIVYWGMPTQKHFALDQDGPDFGKLNPHWVKSNPYTQTTKSGGRHWLWKNPQAKIRNKTRFTGDFDIRGAGGYICLYQVIFNEITTPSDVPKAPLGLLALLKVKTQDTYEKGTRNDSLNKETYQGASEGDTEKILKAVFKSAKSGLDWAEAYKTAMSGISAGGGMPRSDKGSVKESLTDEKEKTEFPKQAVLLQKTFSKLGYELRLNTRKDRIEIKGFTSKKWDEVTDEGFASLFLQVKEAEAGGTKKSFEDRYKALAFNKQVDPFKEYLKALKWDKKPRLESFLFDVFGVEAEHTSLAKWALKSILLAIVKRTFVPGIKHDEFVVFRGPQGIGKSSFLFHLFKDKGLFSNTLSFGLKHKEIVEGTLGKCLIEIAELYGFKQADLEKMKNVITAQEDTVRLAWRKNARDYKRTSVFVGSTNSCSPLPSDLTGLRRFVLIGLHKKVGFSELKKLVKENRDQLWAEAVALYKKGISARLPEDLWELSAKVAEMNRGGDFAFEQAFLDEILDKEWVNVPTILKKLKDGELSMTGQRLNAGWIKELSVPIQNKAAELLKNAGYEDKGRIRRDGKRQRWWKKKQKIEKETQSAGPCPF